MAWRRLHRGGHAERGEAGQVGVVDALRVLDPRRRSACSHASRAASQAVEGGAHGAVADRVHRHVERRRRPPRGRSPRARRRSRAHRRAVQHPRRLRAQRAVHEHLHRPDPQELAAEPRCAAPARVAAPSSSTRQPSCARAGAGAGRRPAAATGRGRPGAGSRARRRRRGRWPRPWPPARPARARAAPARAAGRRKPRARAGRRWGARRRRRKRRRVDPQRVPVVRPQRRRAIAGDRVRGRPRSPAPSGQRAGSASPGRAASLAAGIGGRAQRFGLRAARVRSSSPRASAHPEVHVAVAESGQHAAPVEVDALVADRVVVALAHVDSAGDRAGRRARARRLRGSRGSRV